MNELSNNDLQMASHSFFEKSIHECIIDDTWKYASFTNDIYHAIFSKNAIHYRKILKISDRQSIRGNLPEEVLAAVETLEIAFSNELRRKSRETGRLLSLAEGKEIFQEVEKQRELEPIIRRARKKMEELENGMDKITFLDCFNNESENAEKEEQGDVFLESAESIEIETEVSGTPVKMENDSNDEYHSQIIEILEETIDEYKKIVKRYEETTKEYRETIKKKDEIIEKQRKIIKEKDEGEQETDIEFWDVRIDSEEESNNECASIEINLDQFCETIGQYTELIDRCGEALRSHQQIEEHSQEQETPEPAPISHQPEEPVQPSVDYSGGFTDFMMKVGWFADEMNRNIGPIWFIFPLLLIFVLILKAFY